MISLRELPSGYTQVAELNIQTDKKLRYNIAFMASIVCLVMGLYGNHLEPLALYFRGDMDQIAYVFLGVIVYMVLHEAVHGIFMRIFGAEKTHYGTDGFSTYACSDHFFCRSQYLVIALAPIVIFGAILGIACWICRDTDWFWTLYLIEIVNISSAVSDLYIVRRFFGLPKDVMVQDSGCAVYFFCKQ